MPHRENTPPWSAGANRRLSTGGSGSQRSHAWRKRSVRPLLAAIFRLCRLRSPRYCGRSWRTLVCRTDVSHLLCHANHVHVHVVATIVPGEAFHDVLYHESEKSWRAQMRSNSSIADAPGQRCVNAALASRRPRAKWAPPHEATASTYQAHFGALRLTCIRGTFY